MSVILIALLVITCATLAFFVLIQNPKGGGLAGSFSGLGNQMMGAKQSTDIVEKGTWVSAAALLVLTLGSFILTPKNSNNMNEKTRSEKIIPKGGIQAPAPAAPAQAPAPEQSPAPAQTPAPTPAPTK